MNVRIFQILSTPQRGIPSTPMVSRACAGFYRCTRVITRLAAGLLFTFLQTNTRSLRIHRRLLVTRNRFKHVRLSQTKKTILFCYFAL